RSSKKPSPARPSTAPATLSGAESIAGTAELPARAKRATRAPAPSAPQRPPDVWSPSDLRRRVPCDRKGRPGDLRSFELARQRGGRSHRGAGQIAEAGGGLLTRPGVRQGQLLQLPQKLLSGLRTGLRVFLQTLQQKIVQ